MSEIIIPAKDKSGSFSTYIAYPETTPAPAVILIQEIFGVNEEMRKKCDLLAAEGFIAVCPDLFWRMEPNIQLTDQSEGEWEKAFDLYNRFDINPGIEDLCSVEQALRVHAKCTGAVGCIGYCLGGKLAYLMATRTTIDTSVGYYGVTIEENLHEAGNIKAPLMLHIAEEDEFVPKSTQETIKNRLKEHKNVTLHSYAGVNHAFARGNGKHYDQTATIKADARSLKFLKTNLGIIPKV